MSFFKPVYLRVKPEEIIRGLAGLKPLHAYYIDIKPEVIPLIIIPGFMGTKLYGIDKFTKEKVTVWDPDEPKSMARKYGRHSCNAAEKKKAFIGEDVFNEDYLKIENYANPNNPYLHDCISNIFYGGLIDELNNAGTWTAYHQFFSELPVYSFPYNWTDDNVNSAKKLKEYVEKIINSYKAKGKRCERVILITHSMGGLVARYACKNFISAKVLGVIHVAQPVNGTASTFWRMKCGIERGDTMTASVLKNYITAWTLGTDGQEVTAVLGNMPSALQTLPNCQYTDNNFNPVWLKCWFVDEDDNTFIDKEVQDAHNFINLPQHGDPYEEIYKKFDQCHYLIDKDYLSPENARLTSMLLKEYLKNIDKAKEFHNNIKNYSHPVTFNIFSSDYEYPTIDRIGYKVIVRKPTLSEKCDDLMNRGKDKEAKRCYIDTHSLSTYGVEARKVNLWLANRGGFKKVIIESPTKVLEISLTETDNCNLGDGTVSAASAVALVGRGGNDFNNTNNIEGLKHDAALSGEDQPSKDCLEKIISNIKSILQQQIDKFKAEHPNCKILEDEPKAMCVDEK